MLLGTDVPDELCEVAEICTGMSLISSTIISCGVHHLRELRRKIVVFHLAYMQHLEHVPFTVRELPSFPRRRGKKEKRSPTLCAWFSTGSIKSN